MLSIFTLSVLGAFGASNVLTDVAERTADDDDRSDDLLDDDMLADGLGGDEDLIERLDMFAALGMTPPPDTPTSEAFLPAEDGNDVVHSVFDYVDDATVADLTPEELDVLSEDMAAAHLDALDDGEPTEIISVAVGGPGAVTPNPTESDLEACVAAFRLRYALSFYMLPPGQMMPDSNVTGTEAGFMEAHGLQKLGEVDLGRFEAHFDEASGETVVTDDSRQIEGPQVLANRNVTEIGALFS